MSDRASVKPLASQSLEVHFTFSQSAHEKLRYAQEPLSHQIPAEDLAALFERALDALIPQLEKGKFAPVQFRLCGFRRRDSRDS